MSKFRVNVSECDGIKAFRVFIGFKVNKHIRLQIPDGPIPMQCHGYSSSIQLHYQDREHQHLKAIQSNLSLSIFAKVFLPRWWV